ncbi:11383_t:CDS:1 [Gigaspora rosea]|nr:11383_t:CDS:1 [Gigaspora rosea]
MNHYDRLKEIETSIQKHKQNNVVLPLPTLNESADLYNSDSVSDDSDDEMENTDKECEPINSVDDWNRLICQWLSMISEEDLASEDDQCDINMDDIVAEQNSENTTHPAINNEAK